MNDNERYEVNHNGELVVDVPETLNPSKRKEYIEKMFSINGWKYELINEISPSHFLIRLTNNNLSISKEYHLFHGNIRKEDPERNREEKKIQLGSNNDPREFFDNAIILGFYCYKESDNLQDLIVCGWPIEPNKNYPQNPSLRINMRTDVLPAKNKGYYVDTITGKNLIVFRPEFIYHYLDQYKGIQYSEKKKQADDSELIGFNKIYYGCPGCGKSHLIKQMFEDAEIKDDNIFRVTFHPEYSNYDFVGQLIPKATQTQNADGSLKNDVTYEFNKGPFTLALERALNNKDEMVYLVIEEINRGNASAIFGDLFQLLDRVKDDSDSKYPKGSSEYPITNVNIQKELGTSNVYIPSNLTILATMNTSDQNVFTLDTAFKRRWEFEHVDNNFDSRHPYANKYVPGCNITWKNFVEKINNKIAKQGINDSISDDKRIGKFFVSEDLLTDSYRPLKDEHGTIDEEVMELAKRFAFKILEYLWNDVAKYDAKVEWFSNLGEYNTLEKLTNAFVDTTINNPLAIFGDLF